MELENVVPDKSPNDQREYQAIELPNKLKILFIQDPQAEKAACAVSVGVGSLMDGERSLGLAHFLQHMLFMGSRKFPKFNEYSEFMSLNSGYDNAYTSDDQTNYHFQISNSNFLPAVERLSDFFVKALLTSSCIEKERQAVHEECMLRFGEDNSRKWQILKHFASGPYHNHSIGNNNTLNHPQIEEDLVNFYNNQYSSNRITAVLLSAISIKQMKEKLLPFFEEITNKNLKEIQYETHFSSEKIGKFVKMQSIKDEVLMEFFWIAENTRPFYHYHPQKYITHVIGHQGKNSLLSLLKSKDWASQIISYSHDLPKQTIFGLQVHLTEKGQQEYEAVYSLVTEYVASLKAEKSVYEELKETAAVEFQFKEKGSNFEYVTKLSENLHRIPMNEILSWKSKYNEFKPEIIDKFLQSLRPQNVIVVYSCSEQLEHPITQKHLGGKFIVEELPKIQSKGEKFESLVKNPFLPLNTDIVKSQVKIPVYENGVWFVQGDFGVCKGGIRLKIQKPESQIFLEFYSAYLDLLLKEITYEAQSLQLKVEIDCEDGFTLDVFGFSHTVQKLFEQISPLIATAHKTPLGEKLFKLSLQTLEEEYHNFYEGEVDQITEELLHVALKSTGTTIEERIQELQAYQYKDIAKRIDVFWRTAKMSWIAVGNFQKEGLFQLVKQFEKTVGSDFTCPNQQISCLKLKKGSPVTTITYLESEDIGTSSVIMYKEIGQYDELKYYTLFLLHNYIKIPFFDKLRTEQQLAYYLAAYKNNTRGVLGLNFLLISSNTNPKDISGHITNFIKDFLANSDQDLTSDKFQTLKKSARSQILKPFQSLQEYYKFVKQEIDNGTYCFDRKTNPAQLEGYLAQIKKEEVVQMLRECLEFNLEIWVVSEPHKEEFVKTKLEGQTFKTIKENHEFYADSITRAPQKAQ